MGELLSLLLKHLRTKRSGFELIALIVAIFFFLFLGGCDSLKTASESDTSPTISLKPNSRYSCEVLKVYDGDTFKCKLESGEEVKVRLIGVDTPESSKNQKAYRDAERTRTDVEEIVAMGKEAKRFTESILKKGTKVVLETDVQVFDKYGRVLAYVYLPEGKMLNLLLIEEGYATAYTIPPNVKYAELFRKAQATAMREGRGLWSKGLKEK